MSEGKKEILLGDCLELMKDIPNGSIDAIITDPPYGTTSCKWDSVISFDLMWEQLNRIIKPNGAILLFGSEPFSSALRMSNIKNYKYDWKFQKSQGNNFMLAKKQPIKNYEDILVFYKKQCLYNPQMIQKRAETLARAYRNRNNFEINTEHFVNIKRETKNDKNPLSYPLAVQFFKKEVNNQYKKQVFHPTQKPVDLMEYLIKTYTNEGELVLDFTAGSGTTAIACLNTKRQFIVMEKEQKYYDIILKRVADFNKNFEPKTLFGNEM
jgi:site-specific DNA-methyltransferase (adenine-specific)